VVSPALRACLVAGGEKPREASPARKSEGHTGSPPAWGNCAHSAVSLLPFGSQGPGGGILGKELFSLLLGCNKLHV
jgi:hypothetical protein